MVMNFKLMGWLLRTCALGGALLLAALPASSQTPNQDQIAKTAISTAAKNTTAPQPSFTAYRGVTIGMSAEQVRNKIDHLQDKGKTQDFFVFSDIETAQVVYDKDGTPIGSQRVKEL